MGVLCALPPRTSFRRRGVAGVPGAAASVGAAVAVAGAGAGGGAGAGFPAAVATGEDFATNVGSFVGVEGVEIDAVAAAVAVVAAAAVAAAVAAASHIFSAIS